MKVQPFIIWFLKSSVTKVYFKIASNSTTTTKMFKNLIKFLCLFILVLCQCCYGNPTTGFLRVEPKRSGKVLILHEATGIPDEFTYDDDAKTEADINIHATRNSDHENRISSSYPADEPEGYLEKGTRRVPGYPNLETDIQDLLNIIFHLENLISQTNISNDEEIQSAAKKVVTKVKEGFNKVKNKVKVVYDKVKNKVKVGIDKIKDKIGKIKDNVGTGVGGRDGYGINDNYHRRPYGKRTSADYSGGGGIDPTFLWVFLGLGIAGILGTILYFMIRK